MKEKLYTIPVNDAFHADCECPVCSMYHELQTASIDYVMGPSYMEDDVRAETDKRGFCQKHIKMMYKNQNRLGLTLMLSTHMDYTTKKIETLAKAGMPKKSSFFKKSSEGSSAMGDFIQKMESSCFVCERIAATFDRYIATIFHMYKNEPDFAQLLASSKGFCLSHYGMLYDAAPSYLKGDKLESFITTLNKVYLENMNRVREDLEWFRDKFDYRNADAPWKNSKDALPRSIIKTKSVLPDELP